MDNIHKDIPFGSPVQVGQGVFLLKMPLPFRLDHINLYLIDDQDGWILVDTGLNHRAVRETWEALADTVFQQKPIKKILITHLHPDHIGQAAWLQRRFKADAYISEGDWLMAQRLWFSPAESAIPRYAAHYRAFGVDGERFEQLIENRGNYQRLVKELPLQVKFLRTGDIISAASGDWRVVSGSGHSPEHLCLWNEASREMITGDHVLPKITPNIGIIVGGLSNPLENYLLSLEDFLAIDCARYFPAHGLPSENYHERIAEIKMHHHRQLQKLLSGCGEPTTVFEAVGMLFNTELPPHQYMFALGETAAHLRYLESIGLMHREGEKTWSFKSVSQADQQREETACASSV
ncbi:MBL fold metallo-hydrolase [Hahella sp. HN01]|uniref:MBL fold metallo-hydrolase n=1 Tax=unclassified Hahella TaxID=2624107 RepID=UPI001C1EAB98|nr:MBL fold metallo-hydrolase [Hahella sp. HN01]MBU6950867.1 MBL fold metallo-hydrolase [Hahella sp. HN01]